MPRLMQHSAEFRLGSFFKYLSMEGPFIHVVTEIGHFPDVAAANEKAQELLAQDQRLGFEIRADDGSYIPWTNQSNTWIADPKVWQQQDSRHERFNSRIQYAVLLLLGWLAIGWFNEGFFTHAALIEYVVLGTLLLMFSAIMNRVETFVCWIIILTLCLLFIPTYRVIRQELKQHRAPSHPAS